jgi:hypothetical protein
MKLTFPQEDPHPEGEPPDAPVEQPSPQAPQVVSGAEEHELGGGLTLKEKDIQDFLDLAQAGKDEEFKAFVEKHAPEEAPESEPSAARIALLNLGKGFMKVRETAGELG